VFQHMSLGDRICLPACVCIYTQCIYRQNCASMCAYVYVLHVKMTYSFYLTMNPHCSHLLLWSPFSPLREDAVHISTQFSLLKVGVTSEGHLRDISS
jgi:hypothetical protein